MSRLIPGVFVEAPNNNPFKLRMGQMRSNDFCHNAGWYNEVGKKLGWGDLSTIDLVHIARTLETGEVFYVLNESDSYWEFASFSETPTGPTLKVKPEAQAPGLEYVRQKMRYRLEPNCITYYTHYERQNVPPPAWVPDGITYCIQVGRA